VDREFIPVNVAADMVGYSDVWVRALVKRGIIRSIQEYGRSRVSLPDLIEYREQTRAMGTQKHTLRYAEVESATAT
jgi:hypothetical protein